MIFNKFISGKLTIEVKALRAEKILNAIWNKGIPVNNVIKLDLTTIMFDAEYANYDEILSIVKKYKGKIRITNKNGWLFRLIELKKYIFSCRSVYFFWNNIWII